jgi:hypothetical protein
MMSQRERRVEVVGEGGNDQGRPRLEGRGGPATEWGPGVGSGASLRVSTAKRFRCVPSMFDSLGVQVPYTT